jgi:hypothetical protein
MTWDVHQTRRFVRSIKKLHDNIVVELDEAVSRAAFHPDICIGEKKNGDLKKIGDSILLGLGACIALTPIGKKLKIWLNNGQP